MTQSSSAVPCPIESVLQEINHQITWARDVYQETGDVFHLGSIDALEKLRNHILFVSTEKAEPGDISLADAIEPDEDRLNRIMFKIGSIGESLRNINSMALALV